MGKLIMGKHSYGFIVRRGEGNTITIGKYCSIANDVIFDGGFTHNPYNISTYPFHSWHPEVSHLPSNILIKGDIIVGNDVWIGEGVIIMSGVTIGDGAIVGARAIVTHNVLPYSIVVGSPAIFKKKRFNDIQIDDLLRIKWWDWDDEKVIENARLLQSGKIDEFIERHGG